MGIHSIAKFSEGKGSFSFSVLTADEAHCSPGEPIPITQEEGYIGNAITEDRRFGSEECPWLIHAREGQRINVTLINFARAQSFEDNLVDYNSPPRLKRCYQFAVIR